MVRIVQASWSRLFWASHHHDQNVMIGTREMEQRDLWVQPEHRRNHLDLTRWVDSRVHKSIRKWSECLGWRER
ncbi:hypothetical protein HanPI659440_Chr13g0512181 [Helianthus annuus]|nr:hypothetical protein HanPI659440_Chr13g0512181 [Helianthus annuus]